MTLEEIGRGLGWVGGILYLIQFVEYQVRASAWWQKRLLARITQTSVSTLPPDMRVHKVKCELCGENIFLNTACTHPDAPKYEPIIVSPK